MMNRRVFGTGLAAAAAVIPTAALALPNAFTDGMRRFIYRGYDLAYAPELARDLYAVYGLDALKELKECVDYYVDQRVTHVWASIHKEGFPWIGIVRTFNPDGNPQYMQIHPWKAMAPPIPPADTDKTIFYAGRWSEIHRTERR